MVISVTCSADHSNVISDSLIAEAKNAPCFLQTLLKILLIASEPLRPAKTIPDSDVSFRTWAVAWLLMARTGSASRNWSDTFCCSAWPLLVEVVWQLVQSSATSLQCRLTQQLTTRDKQRQTPHRMRNQCFSCSSSDKSTVATVVVGFDHLLQCISTKAWCALVFPTNGAKVKLPSSTVHHTTRDEQQSRTQR